MKLTIDRSKWLRGEGSEASSLLRSTDSKMCCLGQLALSCGADPDQITDFYSPDCCPTVPWPEGMLLHYNSPDENGDGELLITFDITYGLMQINDDKAMSDAEREDKLREDFAKLNIEVEFVDGEEVQ